MCHIRSKAVRPGLARAGGSAWLTDYSQVDMLNVWYKCVNFGAKQDLNLHRLKAAPGLALALFSRLHLLHRRHLQGYLAHKKQPPP